MSTSLKACHCCGLVQQVRPLERAERALCGRCGSVVSDGRRGASSIPLTLGAALAALVLYPFAIALPVMRIERFGHAQDASIWSGSVGLLREGEWFVGGVVLVCSVLLPLFKLGGLVAITLGEWLHTRHRAFTYRMIEWAGRWGMLDVLLISALVAWVKLGDLMQIQAGPGALVFTTCVLLSLLASAWFDPHALWEEEDSIEAAA